MESALTPYEQFNEILGTLGKVLRKQEELTKELRELRKLHSSENYTLSEIGAKENLSYDTILAYSKLRKDARNYIQTRKMGGGLKVSRVDYEDFVRRTTTGNRNSEAA